MQTTEAIKRRIAELEKQRKEISDEGGFDVLYEILG